jgi:mannose-6-phosphate isomerase-like protein (cupin superfamily)
MASNLSPTAPAYSVGDRAGETVAGLPNQTHAFVNSGSGPLCQIDIHVSRSFSTAVVEDRKGEGNG